MSNIDEGYFKMFQTWEKRKLTNHINMLPEPQSGLKKKKLLSLKFYKQ